MPARSRWMALGAAVLCAAAAAPAQAAFPGRNGLVVFTRQTDVGPAGGEIAVADPTDPGGTPAALTHPDGTFVDSDPAFDATGTRIAFDRTPIVGAAQVMLMHGDGTGVAQVTHASTASTDPAFAPDGTRLVFVRAGDLWVSRLDGSGAVDITNTAGVAESQPAWSPDGTRIAFLRGTPAPYNPGDYAQIWTVRPNGTSPKNLSHRSTAGDWDPSWSPDSRQIAFTSYRKRDSASAGSVWAFSRTGRKPYEVLIAGVHEGNQQPAWSPDGAQLAWNYVAHFVDTIFAGPLGSDGQAQATWAVNDLDDAEQSQPDWQPLP